jgi:hypothetical protein
MPDSVTDPILRQRLSTVQQRLTRGLEQIDPHHRLRGHPIQYKVIAGQTFEIVFRDVPSIDEAELAGVKRLIGERCYCTVMPQTAETLTVRFVVPLVDQAGA